ncbi:unnamed protein product [Didymodactylos carnosus]|uniref:Uncharacterized protein n=1 Tax=Didymodactylos carnosus TaxID=1234261 RepID=A0A813ZX63_9BILA|nr:unnamed protein product [Didymodactylos carnosus]CAF0905404.1 unnamed protein product [Didymodactylos carnosus]CAF3678782.1 unnamed protein product [Didymodactylos carnosus]CAF3687230.1 unnamed protein product [Didymodactylos carnosus]
MECLKLYQKFISIVVIHASYREHVLPISFKLIPGKSVIRIQGILDSLTMNDSFDLYASLKYNEPKKRQRALTTIPLKLDVTKLLTSSYSKVIFTDGYSSLKQDNQYERTLFTDQMEVPCIGRNKQHFDFAEMVTIDIDGDSTRLPLMCKMIIIPQAANQGEQHILVRDANVQWGYEQQQQIELMRIANGYDERVLLTKTNSFDDLFYNSPRTNRFYDHDKRLRYASLTSMKTDNSYKKSLTITPSSSLRVNRLLNRRSMSGNTIWDKSQYYSIPYYQYRSRRNGSKNVGIQVNSNDLKSFPYDSLYNFSLNKKNLIDNDCVQRYSVTVIVPVKNRRKHKLSLLSNGLTNNKNHRTMEIQIPVNNRSKHTTVQYIDTKELVTIQRTIDGQMIEDVS